jgi:hypothetical protein
MKTKQRSSKVIAQAEPDGSAAKIQGYVGLLAVGIGNVAAIISRGDQIREFVSKTLGPAWLYRLHDYFVYGTTALLLIGYGSLTYWLYRNYLSNRSRTLQAAFLGSAFFAVGLTLFASYQFFKEPNMTPVIREHVSNHIHTVLSQQVDVGDASGGFGYSQAGISYEAQAWTTAQCVAALLRQDLTAVAEIKPKLRRAFEYLERSRLSETNDGWGYQQSMKWGVTEVDAWVALAYISSLRPENTDLIWDKEEIPGVIAKTQAVLDRLARRQHDNGGWSVIEKTTNSRHIRSYSTIMAVWAFAEAAKNRDVVAGRELAYRAATTSGAKWLLDAYTTSIPLSFSGWWPNPSATKLADEYPALTAQAIFVLHEVKTSYPFIGADLRYKLAIETFVKTSLEGNDRFEPLIKRQVRFNEKAHDSDRYFEGRPETAELSTFLWYPWAITMASALQLDAVLEEHQRAQMRELLSILLRRTDEGYKFVRNDEVIYPTAEMLFAQGYYFSKEKERAPTAKK